MKLSMSNHMRLEQRMKLAPRMIQSMEVLQLPLLALQEKIEAELNSNPVLEQVENRPDEIEGDGVDEAAEALEIEKFDSKELVVHEGSDNAEDFQRLDNIAESFGDYFEQGGSFRKLNAEASDKKLQALQNTAAQAISLYDSLMEQWSLVDAEDKVKRAGNLIIDYIDDKGFLTMRLEQLHDQKKYGYGMEHLEMALSLIQRLDPLGVGGRDVRECLLIQMSQFPDDMKFEMELVGKHFQDMIENRLPTIAKKMNCTIDDVNRAIAHMSKLDLSPGLQVGRDENHPITADIIITESEDGSDYTISLADAMLPSLQVNTFYEKMSKDRAIDQKTRNFLQQNIHSAQWLMDAIMQRKNTLLRVATAIVKHQRGFFKHGNLQLKPLPMAKIADEVGIHVATVSRAVSGKYAQCPQGVLPLRGFFSGGVEAEDGTMTSWDAVKAQLQQIVEDENKSKPYSDDQLKKKLAENGINDIARRTVAKYRKLMNIPAARFRKKH
jgi:RNA polymerase sigma-54 factor